MARVASFCFLSKLCSLKMTFGRSSVECYFDRSAPHQFEPRYTLGHEIKDKLSMINRFGVRHLDVNGHRFTRANWLRRQWKSRVIKGERCSLGAAQMNPKIYLSQSRAGRQPGDFSGIARFTGQFQTRLLVPSLQFQGGVQASSCSAVKMSAGITFFEKEYAAGPEALLHRFSEFAGTHRSERTVFKKVIEALQIEEHWSHGKNGQARLAESAFESLGNQLFNVYVSFNDSIVAHLELRLRLSRMIRAGFMQRGNSAVTENAPKFRDCSGLVRHMMQSVETNYPIETSISKWQSGIGDRTKIYWE